MNFVDFVHSVVIGSSGKRLALTALGLALFSAVIVALVLAALRIDAWLGVERFMPARAGVIIGVPLFGAGVLLDSSCLFAGMALILRSPSLALGVLPIVIVGACVELKLVEEPELRRRFGPRYAEYARRVPMFVPRFFGRRGMAC
jgi:hypothetical protein